MPVGPAALNQAAPGQRWVVRYRLPDGSATDAIGWIESLSPDRIALSEVGGGRREIVRAAVVLARRAPAARGGPDPRRVSADELQRLSLSGWLAEHEPLGEWTLRSGGGFTGQASSCQAVGDPGCAIAAAARTIIAYAAAAGIAPMAQVVHGSKPERALRELGWTPTYEPTDVLVVRLADLLEARPVDPAVEVSEVLDDSWRAAYQRSRPNSADPAVLELILGGQPPRTYASRTGPGGSRVSIGCGQLSGDWLGLAALWTDPVQRQRGFAAAVLVALGDWAARRGARYAYLKVAVANQSAHAAYERLGFVLHHSYGYLKPPG